ncbi:MAG: alpha/beta hydrolase-fold protein [Planctomycetota bacterium]
MKRIQSVRWSFIASILISSFQITPNAMADEDRPTRMRLDAATIQWVNEPSGKQLPLPTGVTHTRFHSALAGQEISYTIYLPPEYHTEPERRFPVIHHLHGNGGNELKSLPAAIGLHEAIVAGEVPPMILVMFNGGKSTFYKNSSDGQLPIEDIFMQEFITHIDSTYRTIASGKARCIEGFSMGGRGAVFFAMKYPEAFASLFCQAGNVPRLVEMFDDTPEIYRSELYLGNDRDRWVDDDAFHNATKNQSKIKKSMQIQIACGTKDGGHLPTVRDFHNHLLELQIDHTYIELKGLAHRKPQMMKMLGSMVHSHHVDALRQNGVID